VPQEEDKTQADLQLKAARDFLQQARASNPVRASTHNAQVHESGLQIQQPLFFQSDQSVRSLNVRVVCQYVAHGGELVPFCDTKVTLNFVESSKNASSNKFTSELLSDIHKIKPSAADKKSPHQTVCDKQSSENERNKVSPIVKKGGKLQFQSSAVGHIGESKESKLTSNENKAGRIASEF